MLKLELQMIEALTVIGRGEANWMNLTEPCRCRPSVVYVTILLTSLLLNYFHNFK